MKIGGVDVNSPCEEVLILPRLQGDVVIKARAVMSMDEFDKLCPEPAPKKVLRAGGWQENKDDPNYKSQMETYGEQRWNYIALKSLEPSEIEWEKVDLGNPRTWQNWTEELTEAGFSSVEINRITVCVMQANALDESKLEKARDAFLRGPGEAPEKSSGPQTEPQNTPSGEPVKDSE